jgi:hypothetical protein
MNANQKIIISTGLIFITFIIIIALLDFNNVIIALGLLKNHLSRNDTNITVLNVYTSRIFTINPVLSVRMGD